MKKILILGAAESDFDFHNFNVAFRDQAEVREVGFTAAFQELSTAFSARTSHNQLILFRAERKFVAQVPRALAPPREAEGGQ